MAFDSVLVPLEELHDICFKYKPYAVDLEFWFEPQNRSISLIELLCSMLLECRKTIGVFPADSSRGGNVDPLKILQIWCYHYGC